MADEKKEKGGDKGKDKAAAGGEKKKKSFKPYRPGKRACPKCGTGIFLAEHSDRRSCGKCGYFEKR